MLLFFAIMSNSIYSQSDSIREYAMMQPLFRVLDSVTRNIEQQGKSIEMVFYSSGHSLHNGIVLWKSGEKFCGTYFDKEKGRELKKSNISPRKIKSILSSRFFSDNCDLCKLANVSEKDKTDHEYVIYLKRNGGSKCNEMYFTNSAFLIYDNKSCIYDIRELLTREISWPGKVTEQR